MRINRIKLGATVVIAAGAIVLSGCTADSPGSTPATGEPIVVAALSGLTFFPEAPQAVQAVFDDYNDAGGFDGQPIEYTVFDDKTDPAASSTAAKDALDRRCGRARGLVLAAGLRGQPHDVGRQRHRLAPGHRRRPVLLRDAEHRARRTPVRSSTHSPRCTTAPENLRLREHLRRDRARMRRLARPRTSRRSPPGATRPERSWRTRHRSCAVRRATRATSSNLKSAGLRRDLHERGRRRGARPYSARPQTRASRLPFLVLTSCYSDQFAASAVTYGGDIYASGRVGAVHRPERSKSRTTGRR